MLPNSHLPTTLPLPDGQSAAIAGSVIDGRKLEQNFHWQMDALIDQQGPYRSRSWGRLIIYSMPPEHTPEAFMAWN